MTAPPIPSRPIYLDCHATTPVDQRVLAKMLPFFTEHFGNSASTTHAYGWAAEAAVETARQTIATAIGAIPEEIVFTSGATEANNLAIKGVAEAYMDCGRHLVTVCTEHRAVLDPCRYLETLGFEVTYLPVDADGLVDRDRFADALRDDTVLASVMAANNEIGVLQPIADLGRLCRDRGVLFHTDAAQAIGKIPIHVDHSCIDLMSLTAHKIYGPKGIGALYVRRRDPRVRLAPQLHGGGQERNRRSGTLYTPQIVGFAEALAIALADLGDETIRITALRDRLWSHLTTEAKTLKILQNGHKIERLAGNLNISIVGINGSALLRDVSRQLAISSGSACSTSTPRPSHVLMAIGRSPELATASLRFGIGRFNQPDEIDRAAQIVLETIRTL